MVNLVTLEGMLTERKAKVDTAMISDSPTGYMQGSKFAC